MRDKKWNEKKRKELPSTYSTNQPANHPPTVTIVMNSKIVPNLPKLDIPVRAVVFLQMNNSSKRITPLLFR